MMIDKITKTIAGLQMEKKDIQEIIRNKKDEV